MSTAAAVPVSVCKANHRQSVHIVSCQSAVAGLLFKIIITDIVGLTN